MPDSAQPRTCIKCTRSEGVEFYKRGNTCKACCKAYNAAKYVAHPRAPFTETAKACTKCRVLKPLIAFHKSKRGRGGVDCECKVCATARHKAHVQANRGADHATSKRYRQKHPARVAAGLEKWLLAHPNYNRARAKRRWADPIQRAGMRKTRQARRYATMRVKDDGVTTAFVIALLKNPCAYCGGVASSIDHIMPLSLGGLHTVENLAPACRSCNSRKEARTPYEFAVALARKVRAAEAGNPCH